MGEDVRSDFKAQPQHFISHSAYFPLCAVAAAVAEEIEEGAHIHSYDYLCLTSIGENEPCVLVGKL